MLNRIKGLFRVRPALMGLILLTVVGGGYLGVRAFFSPAVPGVSEPTRPPTGAQVVPRTSRKPAGEAPKLATQSTGKDEPFRPLVVEKSAARSGPTVPPPPATSSPPPVTRPLPVPPLPPLPQTLPPARTEAPGAAESKPSPPTVRAPSPEKTGSPGSQQPSIPQQPAQPVQEPQTPPLAVTGIFSGPDAHPLAIVRAGNVTSIVTEGEEVVPGIRVVRIEPEARRVVIAVNGKEVEVRLGGE